MIISHKYKYVFVEVPHTGSTAIASELIENYEGVPVLKKHSHYIDYMRYADGDEKKYFAFSGIRNPLDEAVSVYLKIKGNHKGNYTNPRKLVKNGGFIAPKDIDKYLYVVDGNAAFSDYFLRYYKKPFDNINCLSARHMKSIIRFENLVCDFDCVIKALGVDPVRRLPLVNKTEGKSSYIDYYDNEEVVKNAVEIFGPFMKKWGYSFPSQWGDVKVSLKSLVKFKIYENLRKIYYLRGYHI